MNINTDLKHLNSYYQINFKAFQFSSKQGNTGVNKAVLA